MTLFPRVLRGLFIFLCVLCGSKYKSLPLAGTAVKFYVYFCAAKNEPKSFPYTLCISSMIRKSGCSIRIFCFFPSFANHLSTAIAGGIMVTVVSALSFRACREILKILNFVRDDIKTLRNFACSAVRYS